MEAGFDIKRLNFHNCCHTTILFQWAMSKFQLCPWNVNAPPSVSDRL